LAVKNEHHQVSFDFPIKSIIPGTDDNLLLIETADTVYKAQTFLLLSFEPLEIIQAMSFADDYAGLVAKSFDSNQLLFIQYSDQNNPDLTNIYTFKWDGGEPNFCLQNTRIIQSGLDWIKVPHPHFANKEIYINLESGAELKTIPLSHPASSYKVSYATAYQEDSEYFQWFVQYFEKHNIIPCRQIEYLKSGEKLLISYYEKNENELRNSLAILDNDGKILDSILLGEHLKGIGKDTFFVYRNKVIFVTQKSTLNIYDL